MAVARVAAASVAVVWVQGGARVAVRLAEVRVVKSGGWAVAGGSVATRIHTHSGGRPVAGSAAMGRAAAVG